MKPEARVTNGGLAINKDDGPTATTGTVIPRSDIMASRTCPDLGSSVYSTCPLSGIIFSCWEAQIGGRVQARDLHILRLLTLSLPTACDRIQNVTPSAKACHIQWFFVRVEK